MVTIRTVTTRGVNDRMAENADFASAVWEALGRFGQADWGTVDPEDWALNDASAAELDNGQYGRVLAAYGVDEDKFWIIRDTEVVTVLFPSEY